MKRNILNFIVDGATLALMLGMVATGVLIRYILPPGSGGGAGGRKLVLWGWGRHDWGGLHFWLAAGLIGLLVIHLTLHWTWVCGTARRMLSGGRPGTAVTTARRRTLYGSTFVGTLAVALTAFFWIASNSTRYIASAAGAHATHAGPEGPRRVEDGHSSHEAGDALAGSPAGGQGRGELIRGSMTLGEAASAAGVPLEDLRRELRLPDSVGPEERLGRLSREYDFELSHLRDLLSR